MTVKFIIFNGPPKSGKDTVGHVTGALIQRALGDQTLVIFDKLAKPLKAAVGAFAGLNQNGQDHFFETPAKDVEHEAFLGQTPRQMLISFSENWVKPNYGQDAFGRLMVARCKEYHKNHNQVFVIITDCGFKDEIQPIINAFGGQNIAFVRLHREGTTFFGDSRNYVYWKKGEMGYDIDLDNNGEISEAALTLINQLRFD